MKILCTGLNSSVGNLLNSSQNLNYQQIKKNSNRNSNFMEFEFNSNLFGDADYMFHLAWNMQNRKEKESYDINVMGSFNLINQLSEQQMKQFIFLSTVNASEESTSVYERHKRIVEQKVIERGGSVIRAGVIYDENAPFSIGLIKNIFNLAKKFPMLPNFSGSKRIYYLTSIRKIEKELIKLIESKENKSKIIKCFDIGPINFRFLVNDFMRLEKKIVNVPWIIGFTIALLFDKLKINFPLTPDSLRAIK